MKCAISGSFRKFYPRIVDAILTFNSQGVTVLSPPFSEIVNEGDEFVIFASDHCEDPGVLAEKHLAAIRQSDFLYLYNPRGYIGVNTAMEIGYAHAHGIPIIALAFTGNPGIDCFINYVLMPDDVRAFFLSRDKDCISFYSNGRSSDYVAQEAIWK